MIKAVIFDVGGVLYKPSYKGYYPAAFRYFSGKFKIKKPVVEHVFRSSDYRIATGRETMEIFLKRVSKKLGRKILPEEFMKIADESAKNMDPNMLALAKRLKSRYTVAVLSDVIHGANIATKKKLRRFFHKMYFSDELRMKKPSPAAYRHVCKDLCVKPRECFFVDDKIENVRGAKRIGMHAVQFKNYSKLLKDLKNHGVIA